MHSKTASHSQYSIAPNGNFPMFPQKGIDARVSTLNTHLLVVISGVVGYVDKLTH